jgi:hypothetical protein
MKYGGRGDMQQFSSTATVVKQAVVIVHGVGQHQPYQTSRAFAEGCAAS